MTILNSKVTILLYDYYKKYSTCSMPGKCNTDKVVYSWHLTWQGNTSGETKKFQKRYGSHKHQIDHEDANHTKLISFIWTHLKGPGNSLNIPYSIKLDILGRANPFNPTTGVCRLCNLEKYHILLQPQGASLNQRSEFFTQCKHKEPQLLVAPDSR